MNYFIMPGLNHPVVGRSHLSDKTTQEEIRKALTIIAIICTFYNIPQKILCNPRLRKKITKARHITFFFLRERTILSLTAISGLFVDPAGKIMNHTSVMYGDKMVRDQISVNNLDYLNDIRNLSEILKPKMTVSANEPDIKFKITNN